MDDPEAVARGMMDTAPATDAAKQWEGWGTALKPAWEPIVLARKPLIGTVAANVQQFGTGAINVDGCRVEGLKDIPASPRKGANGGDAGGIYGRYESPPVDTAGWNPHAGRWPANLVLSVPEDEYQLKRFVTPAQKRELHRWLSENA
jgi:site-specific DNA-methyltransferase (adenine-specific)